MKIMLDAGHYGKRNQSPVLPSYYESEMTWKLTNYLKEALESHGITVGLTRKEQTKDLDVYKRGQMAKGYDLFVSIHSNACGTEYVDRPTMIVNLDGKTTDLGKVLGMVIRQKMETTQDAKITTRQWTDRPGVEYYGVLRGSHDAGVKGIIVEHSFHTNLRSAKWLSVDDNLKKLAKAEADCIASFYGIKKETKPEAPAKPEKPKVEAFKVGDKVKVNAGVTKYSNGKNMASWVKNTTLYVRQIESNGTVLLVSVFPVLKLYTGRVKSTDVHKV